MMKWCRVAVCVAILACPLVAHGNGLFGLGRGSGSYYYTARAQPAPVYYCVCPVYFMPPCQATAAPPPFAATPPPPFAAGNAPPALQAPQKSPIYATPQAAPPSSGPVPSEPPPAAPAPRRSPSVSESRAYYEAYPVSVQDPARRFGERCSIEFWNLTNKDLTLKVDGQSRTLTQGKNLTLDVARRFAWQIEGRDLNQENIAMGEAALQIVIRR